MTLAPYIRTLGRGPSKSRHLTQDEARDALNLIIKNQAPPETVGALFMLLRYRGESAEELAGFTEAMRADCADWQALEVDLDWPSYSAGKSRGLPWYLMAAKLLAQDGTRVILHGWNSHQLSLANPRDMLEPLRIPLVKTVGEATDAIARARICYVGLETLSPRILELLQLRETLGLRSPVNSALRLLNPALAPTSVQGVFHPNFQELQRNTALILGQSKLGVIKGGGGEFEVNPFKPVEIRLLDKGAQKEIMFPPALDDSIRILELSQSAEQFGAIWRGEETDERIEALIIATTSAALVALGSEMPISHGKAQELWKNRLSHGADK